MSEKTKDELKQITNDVCDFLSDHFPRCKFFAVVKMSEDGMISMGNMQPNEMFKAMQEILDTRSIFSDISNQNKSCH